MGASQEIKEKPFRNSLLRGALWFYNLFLKPVSIIEDRRRREFILNIILIGSIAMLGALEGMVVYYYFREGGHFHGVSPFIFVLLPIFFIFLHVIARKGWSRAAAYLLIGGYFLSNSYAAYRWGIDLQIVILAYALIALMANILVNTKFGFITAAAIGAYIIPVGYAQLHGILPVDVRYANSTWPIIFTFFYLFIALIAWLSNREIEQSLARARHSEEVLEAKVEERTRNLREAQFQKMEQVRHLAEFGELASGLLHDLINLLMISLPAGEMRDVATRVRRFIEGIKRQLKKEDLVESFSMLGTLEAAIELLSYAARESGVRLILDSSEDIIYFGNPLRFHQVAVNLITNAIESYTNIPHKNREKVIKISLTRQKDDIYFSVKDNGRGIPAEIQGKIFEFFFTNKAESDGMGIGLSLVKKIIERDFGGKVSVVSKEGEGSTFTASFPIHAQFNNE